LILLSVLEVESGRKRGDIPAREKFGNLSPFITILFVCLKDDEFLLFSPRFFVDVRVEVVVPSI
jgi:hypothetical protein